MDSKTCNKCKQVKNIDNFHKNSIKRSGYSNECKDCTREYNQIRLHTNTLCVCGKLVRKPYLNNHMTKNIHKKRMLKLT